MRPWHKRSIEEANLLNPAFLSIIIQRVIIAYSDSTQKNAPYVLPFLATSIVLHKPTRDALPMRIDSTFATWVTQLKGSHAMIGYPERTRSIVPYVKEALTFSLINNMIIADGDGSFRVKQQISVPTIPNDTMTDEVVMCFKKAHFCGRWLAKAGKIETVMALLGVKP
ncbi:MAG: DUF6521 family protein [Erysipelotrichaceae bacterium]|nr:DUF6521 family protein [Erysipelotrichaceae bacterium]